MTLAIDCDLRPLLAPVRDQGRRPTCLSFAASAAHEHARIGDAMLSVEWLFHHAAQRARTGPECGTTLPHTRRVLQELGQPDESVWPYCGRMPDLSTWVPPVAETPLYKCGSESCESVTDTIRFVLETGRPAVVALFASSVFTASDRWIRTGEEVVLPKDPEPIDRSRGHAVVAVGYGRFEGVPVLLLRNSWGRLWAADGHAWVTQVYLEGRLIGGFAVTEGDSDVLQPDAGGRLAHTRVG